jgi:hypothetical protein
MSPETVADLYSVPPPEFMDARNRAVAQARDRGDDALAKEIGKLRKPTTAAWMINLVAHRRPELIARLLDIGGELRRAQQAGQVAKVRELSEERGRATRSIVAAARDLAGAGKVPVDELDATLFAAVSDPDVGATVSAGRLERTVAYSGFGGLGMVDAPTAPAAATPAAKGNQRRLVQAREAADDARIRLAKTTAEHTAATEALDEMDEEVKRLAARRKAAAAAVERAAGRRADAERRLAEAEARLADLA